MAISSHQVTDRVHLITLSGLLAWAEFQAFLARVETENVFASGKVRVLIRVFASGKVRVLIRLEGFAGWEPGEQWGDVSFFFRHDKDIERIAVVGDPRWRDQNADVSVRRLPASRSAVFPRDRPGNGARLADELRGRSSRNRSIRSYPVPVVVVSFRRRAGTNSRLGPAAQCRSSGKEWSISP